MENLEITKIIDAYKSRYKLSIKVLEEEFPEMNKSLKENFVSSFKTHLRIADRIQKLIVNNEIPKTYTIEEIRQIFIDNATPKIWSNEIYTEEEQLWRLQYFIQKDKETTKFYGENSPVKHSQLEKREKLLTEKLQNKELVEKMNQIPEKRKGILKQRNGNYKYYA